MADNPYNIDANPDSLKKALVLLREDFDAHNHDGTSSRAFQTLSAETVSAHTILIRKTSFTDTINGFWSGLVGDILKWYLGDGTNYIKWDGATLTITGTITGSVITGGSLNIGNGNFTVDSSGNAQAIGMSTLNMKAYTNFEASTRFIGSTGGSGSNTFGNQGVTVAPGATGGASGSYARLLWWITNFVFANNPTFTCSFLALSGFQTADGRAFVGLGSPGIDGLGIYTLSKSYAGFRFQKNSGTTTIIASNNNGDGSNTTETNLFTVANGDSVELMLKISSTDIKYYYRSNGGPLTLGATHTTRIPTASENYIAFMSSNGGSANDFQVQMQCAAYEH